jgi:hypothetical protein
MALQLYGMPLARLQRRTTWNLSLPLLNGHVYRDKYIGSASVLKNRYTIDIGLVIFILEIRRQGVHDYLLN